MCVECSSMKECEKNLIETEYETKRFGRIFRCKNCGKYYIKVGIFTFEVRYVEDEGRWTVA